MEKIISFQEAIEQSKVYSKRILLLGNGFSIAAFPDIFRYGTLFEKTDFSKNPEVKSVFSLLKTSDFEFIIKSLGNTAIILPVYDTKAQVSEKIRMDAVKLKELLVDTIAGSHPENPNAIEENQFQSCCEFLSHFIGGDNNGKVYSLNYDLLLYWSLLSGKNNTTKELKKNDGFGKDLQLYDNDFVFWKGEDRADNQTIYFLHGALYIFDNGVDVSKYTWVNTGLPLVSQIREALMKNKYPLIVTEGSAEEKISKIKHSAYLYHAYKSFSREMEQKGKKKKCIFIHGHSLDDVDRHILDKIEYGQISHMFVSLHGDSSKPKNVEIMRKADAMSQNRDEKSPLKITFYDAQSAKVWG